MKNLKTFKFVGFLCFLVSAKLLSADIIITQRAANPYKLISEDIWNLEAISAETQSVTAVIHGEIKKDNQVIVTLDSRPVVISPGAHSFSSFNIQTSRKNYFNNNIAEIEKLTQSLPPGNYTLCITVSCANAGCDGLGRNPFLIEQGICMQTQLELPTPLQLTFPEDRAKIKEVKPTLMWIPPGPIAQSSKLTFIVTLVEIEKGQNKMDAIKRNRPLLRKTGHSLTSLMYPMDLADLEVGHQYAWQVEAWVGDQWISTSEVWEFEIEEDKKEIFKFVYYQPKPIIGLETYQHRFQDTFAITAEENYIEGENTHWNISAKDILTGEYIDISSGFEQIIKKGKQNLYIVFSDNFLLKVNSTYVLTIKNSANEKIYIRIQLF